jgi:predicted transcriptional regulator
VIRERLDYLGLTTEPDFNWVYIDAPIVFKQKTPPLEEGDRDDGSDLIPEIMATLNSRDANIIETLASLDPTYRVGRLGIANRPPISISPDGTIKEAVTIMLRNDFSQLPVMTSDREVKGMIGWRSLGSRLSFGQQCEFVRDCMERHGEISVDDSLFHAIAQIKQYDCVLVRDLTKKICGIVTAYDVSVTFHQLAEPFLVLGQIENFIRVLIDGRFSASELASVRASEDTSRVVHSVADLTLGECVRLLENPKNWERLELAIDRATFIKDLDGIREIRNDVMHFDPEGIDDDGMRSLREFAEFLERLQSLRSRLHPKKASAISG